MSDEEEKENTETVADDEEDTPQPKGTQCCDKSIVILILGIIGYFASNIGINLFNKWMFSVLLYKVPLTVTAVHQLVAALIFLPLEWQRSFSRNARIEKEHEKKGLPLTERCCGSYLPVGVTRRTFFVIIFGLASVSALNYGLVAVSLMKLSQADHQLIRSTGPLFVAVTFYVVESRQFTLIKLLVLFMTVGGVILAVLAHSVTFKLDPTGIAICVGANVAVALQMSLTGLAKHRLKLDAVSTIAFTSFQITVFLTPFIFITGEQKIVANLVATHLSKFIGCLIAGSVIVILYLLIATYLIQQTNSLFVAIAANFKMVTIILLSELLVENTKLNAGVYVGMAIVTAAFLGSFANDQYLDKVKKADRLRSPCIDSPCLDRLSDPFCTPTDPKTDNRQPLCCGRDALDEQEEQPFLT